MHQHTDGHVLRHAWAYDAMVQVMSFGRAGAFRRRSLELSALAPGEHLLDVGCGTGSLAIEAARQRPDASILGIDPAPTMIAHARAKAARAGVQARFEEGVIEALPYEDARFDVVTSSIMMHHLPPETLAAGLAEIQRVLRPGGRLVVVDFAGAGPLLHKLGALMRGEHGPPDSHRDRVRDAVAAQGFTDPSLHTMRPSYLFGLVARRSSQP
jgi:ubiquinone/menaquinone biosynthesis C-methylase UbiE